MTAVSHVIETFEANSAEAARQEAVVETEAAATAQEEFTQDLQKNVTSGPDFCGGIFTGPCRRKHRRMSQCGRGEMGGGLP